MNYLQSLFADLPQSVIWAGFGSFIVTMLLLDLFVFHRKSEEMSFKRALGFTIFWVALAAAFNGFIHVKYGVSKALEFTSGYLLEQALSVDNLFVFLVVFAYFRVPKDVQHRVLFWGILGALVLRGIFIFAGVAIVTAFHWVLYIFGVFLIWTGWKLLRGGDDDEPEPEKNPVLGLFRRLVPMVNEYRGKKFIVVENGKRYATPLLLVLVVIEASDVMFAVDSIPAVFGVSKDPLIIYTSNIFAILGLRSMFFVIAGAMSKFEYLKYGLGLVLVFIGLKMLTPLVGIDHVPTWVGLGGIVLLLGGSIVMSVLRPPANPKDEKPAAS